MAITECGKGHIYDADQYAACPYCNGGGSRIDFGAGGQNPGDRTVAPGMGQGYAPEIPAPPPYTPYESGPTVAPESYRREQEAKNRTVGVFQEEYGIDPVVGWLVCVEGPEKGKDYRLWARINSIGRDEDMDVCIKADKTITQKNHARLAYDPRQNNFQLIPAGNINNIYLNNEPVYIPVRLSAYDVIEMGKSKMVFVPFCCDRFQWTAGEEAGREGER